MIPAAEKATISDERQTQIKTDIFHMNGQFKGSLGSLDGVGISSNPFLVLYTAPLFVLWMTSLDGSCSSCITT
jgi:hypothetical protein